MICAGFRSVEPGCESSPTMIHLIQTLSAMVVYPQSEESGNG